MIGIDRLFVIIGAGLALASTGRAASAVLPPPDGDRGADEVAWPPTAPEPSRSIRSASSGVGRSAASTQCRSRCQG